jgi:hypothetical protein
MTREKSTRIIKGHACGRKCDTLQLLNNLLQIRQEEEFAHHQQTQIKWLMICIAQSMKALQQNSRRIALSIKEMLRVTT